MRCIFLESSIDISLPGNVESHITILSTWQKAAFQQFVVWWRTEMTSNISWHDNTGVVSLSLFIYIYIPFMCSVLSPSTVASISKLKFIFIGHKYTKASKEPLTTAQGITGNCSSNSLDLLWWNLLYNHLNILFYFIFLKLFFPMSFVSQYVRLSSWTHHCSQLLLPPL